MATEQLTRVCVWCKRTFHRGDYYEHLQACHTAHKIERISRQWIADHPAEAIAALVEAGVMEMTFDLIPADRDPFRLRDVYRVSLPTDPETTDG